MKESQYLLFFKKTIKFLVIFVVLDLSFGTFAEYLFFNQKSGKYARITYSLEKANADIFIFGSSHANRHYIPNVFEKKLKLTCYNVGIQGQDLIFQMILEEIILNRTIPKIIVLNIDGNWLYESQQSYDRLSDLYPYFSKYSSSIEPIVSQNSKWEQFALRIKPYRLNSTVVHYIRYVLFPQYDQNGYLPLLGEMTPNNKPIVSKNIGPVELESKPIDQNFVNALNQFIQNAKDKNIEIFFVISPTNAGLEIRNKSYELIKEIAQKKSVPLISFLSDVNFIGKNELFYDADHLNNKGANLFSEMLSDTIGARINPKTNHITIR